VAPDEGDGPEGRAARVVAIYERALSLTPAAAAEAPTGAVGISQLSEAERAELSGRATEHARLYGSAELAAASERAHARRYPLALASAPGGAGRAGDADGGGAERKRGAEEEAAGAGGAAKMMRMAGGDAAAAAAMGAQHGLVVQQAGMVPPMAHGMMAPDPYAAYHGAHYGAYHHGGAAAAYYGGYHAAGGYHGYAGGGHYGGHYGHPYGY
jgi:hypothetical protein